MEHTVKSLAKAVHYCNGGITKNIYSIIETNL